MDLAHLLLSALMHHQQTIKTQKRTLFHLELLATFDKHKAKGPTYQLGDFNARVQTRLPGEAEILGTHTFNKQKITLDEQAPDTRTNRQLFIEHATATN